MNPHDVYGSAQVPPVLAYFILVISFGSLLAAVVVCFRRAAARRHLSASAAASASDKPPPLVEGAEVVLSGIVHHFEDHDVAVRVLVKQDGSEWESSGSWSHKWTEIDREIIVAPFMLELATGERVLVRAPKNVDVADELDQKVFINRTRRVLQAELVPGERIFARGTLERSDLADPTAAYRDVKWGWSLVPSRGKMLLSSEPLGEGLAKRATFHSRAGWFAVMALLLLQLVVVGFYAQIGDRVEVMTVLGTSHWTTKDNEGGTSHHYSTAVKQPSTGQRQTFMIGSFGYDDLFEGADVFVRTDSIAWHIGSRPTFHILIGLVLAGTALAFWLIYRSRRWWSRPWFRRKVNETCSGQLPG